MRGPRPSFATCTHRSIWVAKIQWARAADLFDIDITDSFGRGTGLSADFQGLAVTYAGVAAATHALRTLVESRRTLVILDEIHHAGDAMSWGESVQEAFTPATRRLSLTGTPFRSDINPIPFVRYRRGSDGILRSEPDFSYSYGAALADEAVRPVLFLAYSGRMTWRTRVGDEVTAELGIAQAKEVTAAAWRTALAVSPLPVTVSSYWRPEAVVVICSPDLRERRP